MTRAALLVLAAFLIVVLHVPAAAQPASAPQGLQQALRALSADATRRITVDSAGLTRSGLRLLSIESAGMPDTSRPKLVVIGGLDGNPASTTGVVRFLQWWFEDREAAPLRGAWQIAAVPCARPGVCDAEAAGAPLEPPAFPPTGAFYDGSSDPTPHHLWRWTTLQAPTVVVDMRNGGYAEWDANTLATALVNRSDVAMPGSLAAALAGSVSGPAWSAGVPALQLSARPNAIPHAIRDLLARSGGAISPLRIALAGRERRAPLDLARLLALKYPAQPVMSYIPALSWSAALRLATLTSEPRFRDKALADLKPFLSGATPPIAEPYQLTSLAGHLALSDLGALDPKSDGAAMARKAADFILPTSEGELVRFARGWTDDMFMATSVLARVAARAKDDSYAEAAGRLLTGYATALQRPDGLFIHAKEGPFAWGRGTGFAAFGLMEALTYLPASWPDRARVMESYRALMKGLLAHQAPDGMWRQVVDEPGSYREFSVTAMVLTAMGRGVRLGWLDPSYRPAVDRAWRGLLLRIGEDGSVIDVCTGTASGSTRDYYLNRAGITGADDRGGAMALTAAIEMEELLRTGARR